VSQSAQPAWQVSISQAPITGGATDTHLGFAFGKLHAFLQAPHWLGSVLIDSHSPFGPQLAEPIGQSLSWQAPLTHSQFLVVSMLKQLFPQVPQWPGVVARFVSQPVASWLNSLRSQSA
jgi:hypothetical protein